MKRILATFSVLILASVLTLKVANAQTTPQDTKKASTEAKKDCPKCTKSKDCPMMTAAKTDEKKACCKEMSADAKATTADHSACKGKTETACKGMASAETKCCDKAKSEMAKN